MLRAIVASALLLAGAASFPPKPPEIGAWIDAPHPYGVGTASWLVFTAYEASLWADSGTWSMSSRFALSLQYRMSFTKEELVESTINEMGRVAPGFDASWYRNDLERAFANVVDGDRITALHLPGEGVRFFHNGNPTATVEHAVFADPFFAIWLSEGTSAPELRADLLRLDASP
jgi:hypothetical protein